MKSKSGCTSPKFFIKKKGCSPLDEELEIHGLVDGGSVPGIRKQDGSIHIHLTEELMKKVIKELKISNPIEK